jgi:hypothetical protein
MTHIEKSIQINCRSEQAFALATDFNKAATWQTGVIEAKLTSEGAVGVGTTYAWTAKALGQTMETRGEVTVWNPPSAYEWKATKSPFPLAGGMKFQADGSGTLVTRWTSSLKKTCRH